MTLIEELKRRRVFRVAVLYLVAAWAVVQVTTTVFPVLRVPEWVARDVIILAIIGFPVALMLGWIFDITPAGLHRTTDHEEAPAPPHGLRGYALGRAGVAALVLLVGIGAYARYARASTSIRSIAVLPFVDMSATHDQQYFAEGIAEELL